MNNNNEENILDVDELYKIASRLKEAKNNRISAKSILAKNPSSSIRDRYSKAKEEYGKALNDFDYFIKNYIQNNLSEESSDEQSPLLIVKDQEIINTIKYFLNK